MENKCGQHHSTVRGFNSMPDLKMAFFRFPFVLLFFCTSFRMGTDRPILQKAHSRAVCGLAPCNTEAQGGDQEMSFLRQIRNYVNCTKSVRGDV